MVKPYEIRIKDGRIFILDQYSVLIYDSKTFKMIKTLCRRGEGPQEIKTFPRIELTDDKIFVTDNTKVIIYDRNFTYLKEYNMGKIVNRIVPIQENFVVSFQQDTGKDKFTVFLLYNSNMKELKKLVLAPIPNDVSNILISPWPKCRNWKDKVFISIPQKGFYIEIYDKNGSLLYKIEKKMNPVKAGEKHRKLVVDEWRYFLGRKLFNKVKERGQTDIPIRDPLPLINNFWVFDDHIYVKTYHITDTAEKFVITDLKGNTIKSVFLPWTYKELFTFDKERFYYLSESENEGWDLHCVDF